LARAAPALPAGKIIKMHQAETVSSRNKRGKPPSNTAHGASRKQLLVTFVPGTPTPDNTWEAVQRAVNNALRQHESSLRVLSGEPAYGGWALKTNGVADEREIGVTQGAILTLFPQPAHNKVWVGLPQSVSYLKIRSVPYYSSGNTRLTPADVHNAFDASEYRELWKPTGPTRIDQESKTSTRVTAYFNIWDSTRGTRSKALVGKRILICGVPCTIAAAAEERRSPLVRELLHLGSPIRKVHQRYAVPYLRRSSLSKRAPSMMRVMQGR
jgi:hypothetical protein